VKFKTFGLGVRERRIGQCQSWSWRRTLIPGAELKRLGRRECIVRRGERAIAIVIEIEIKKIMGRLPYPETLEVEFLNLVSEMSLVIEKQHGWVLNIKT
jgi:hypothetical protein